MKKLTALSYKAIDAARAEIMENPAPGTKALGSLYFSQAQAVMDNASRLRGALGQLAEHLTDVDAMLERDPLSASVNSLGEVQALGSFVDAACGEYHASREALRRMDQYIGGAR